MGEPETVVTTTNGHGADGAATVTLSTPGSPTVTLLPGSASSTSSPQRRLARVRTLLAAHPAGLPAIPSLAREVAIEAELLTLTNAHRATLGAQALVPDATLDGIACWKADDCADGMYLQHDQPATAHHGAFTISDRFTMGGWSPYYAWGENIAYGLQTAADVLAAFLSDIGHRQNVEATSWNVCGFAVVTASNGLRFAVQDFGDIPGNVPPPPRVLHPMPGEKWRRSGRVHAPLLTIDKRTTGTVVWFTNPQGLAAHKRLAVFLSAYERVG